MKTNRIFSIAMTLAMGMIAGLHASVTEHQPPAPLPEFKTPEQLAKWRAETTARTANQESTSSRLSPLDSSTPFYTGKPYLAESGSYAFKYREYNPEMGRWTTVDPSGFPDGANNRMYAAVPTSQMDADGLVVINSFSDATNYWKRPNGNPGDIATLGGAIISDIESSLGFSDLINRIQKQRIKPALLAVNQQDTSGTFNSGGTLGPADIGFVDLVIGRSSITYDDTTTWTASTKWVNKKRAVIGSTTMMITCDDLYDFSYNPQDPPWLNLIEEAIPNSYLGPGVPYIMTASFSYNFKTGVYQLE